MAARRQNMHIATRYSRTAETAAVLPRRILVSRRVQIERLVIDEARILLLEYVVALNCRKSDARCVVGHSWCIMLAIRITRVLVLNNRQMLHVILHQVAEYLLRVEIVLAEGPIDHAYHLLTLVAQGHLHVHQQLSREVIVSVRYVLLLDAPCKMLKSYLELALDFGQWRAATV